MMTYKYFIDKKEKGYSMGLYPNNNNGQSIILFNNYKTEQEAKLAILNFKTLVHNSKNYEDIVEFHESPRQFYFTLKENKYGLEYTSHIYNQKANLIKAINAIYNHIDVELKQR